MGTFGGGLNRYVGETDSFVHYLHDPENPRSLSHNTVRTLYQDDDGLLWIGTGGGGLNVMDPERETFRRIHAAPHDPRGLISDDIKAFVPGEGDDFWIGTDQGLVHWHRNYGLMEHYGVDPNQPDGLGDLLIMALCLDRNKGLWVGTMRDGLYRLDLATRRFTKYLDYAEPHSGVRDVWAIYEDRDGVIWSGAGAGGLHRFDTESQNYVHYLHDPMNDSSLSANQVRAIYEDRGGVMWIGTKWGGLNHFNRHQQFFRTITSHPGRSDSLQVSNVASAIEDQEGRIWVGTKGGGLTRTNAQFNEFRHYRHDEQDPNSLSGDLVRSLAVDSKGTLWIGMDGGGLNRYVPERDAFVRYPYHTDEPDSLSGNRVRRILVDSRDELWILLMSGGNLGMDRFSPEEVKVVHYGEHSGHGFVGRAVNTVVEDHRDDLWVGTDGSGLNRWIRDQDRFVHIPFDPDDPNSLSNGRVLSLLIDSQSRLWVGTAAGIHHVVTPSGRLKKVYGNREGLTNQAVLGMLEDDQGRLWLGTNNGIFRFEPDKEVFTHYSEHNGTGENAFNIGCYAKTRDNLFLFGGINGLTAFYPEKIKSNRFIPPVVFTAFTRPEPDAPSPGYVPELSALTLDHRDLVFSLSFAALDYSYSDSNRYAYFLEGFNRDWIQLGTRREVTFTNLDAGDYVLRVKGSNNDGVWNEEGATLRINIKPAPWKSPMAYALYLLALFGSIAWYIHLQKQKLAYESSVNERLRQLDRLKDEFLANTSHELRTPLNGIIGLAESLMDGIAGKLPPGADENLSLIVSSGKRLASLVNDLLDFSRLKNKNLELQSRPVDLRASTEVVFTLCAPLAVTRHLDLVNEVPGDIPPVLADENRLQQILYNLIGNAIKFTEQGSVRVQAREKEEMLEIRVVDTGIGIPAERLYEIFEPFKQVDGSMSKEHGGTGLGLAVSRQLVDLHGGDHPCRIGTG